MYLKLIIDIICINVSFTDYNAKMSMLGTFLGAIVFYWHCVGFGFHIVTHSINIV